MRINETCSCGCGLSASSDDEAALSRVVMEWRASHPCPARQRAEREVVSGAQAEQAYAAPHRSDAELGFRPSPTVAEAREELGYDPAPPTVPSPRPAEATSVLHVRVAGHDLARAADRYRDDGTARR